MIGITNAGIVISDDATSAIDFATADWGIIANLSQSGKASQYFQLGDTKTTTDGLGNDITITIIAFDYDTYINSSKAGITFCVSSDAYADVALNQIPLENVLEESYLPNDIPIQSIYKGNSVYRVFYMDEDDVYDYAIDYVFYSDSDAYWLPHSETVITTNGISDPSWLGDRAPRANIVYCFCV